MVRESGLPYFHISEEQQSGDTFGERFANAIQHVFGLGFDHIISVGNDTPQLSIRQLQQAAHQLSLQQNVLGPAQDGGFYLMGIHKTDFDYQEFIELPWQTSKLLQVYAERILKTNESIFYFERLQDIDSLADVLEIVGDDANIILAIKKLLRSIIRRFHTNFRRYYIFNSTHSENQHFNKGSPTSLHL